ncbi:MAG: hypothetical protein AAFO04_11895 [Cyanobacteria bacterium J06592_8]
MKAFLCQVLLACGSAFSLLSATVHTANAAFFFDFDTPFPNSVISAGINSNGEVVPFLPSIETLDNNSFLRLSSELAASEGGFATSLFANTAYIFEDVQVSAVVNLTGDSNDEVAVLARGDLSTLNSYNAAIDFALNRLILSKTVGGEVTVLADALNILPALDQPYLIELEVIGNQLTSRFFDATGDVELFSLSAVDTDNPLVAGISGLAADISQLTFPDFSDPNNSTFDNFDSRSISVPEPNHLSSLLAVASIAMITTFKQKF